MVVEGLCRVISGEYTQCRDYIRLYEGGCNIE